MKLHRCAQHLLWWSLQQLVVSDRSVSTWARDEERASGSSIDTCLGKCSCTKLKQGTGEHVQGVHTVHVPVLQVTRQQTF